MKARMLAVLGISLGLLVSVPSFASVQHAKKTCRDCGNAAPEEVESYASLSFLAGIGTANDRFGDGDVTRLAAIVDYPVAAQVSLLARWDHEQINWDDAWVGRWGSPSIGDASESNVFSFGLKVTLK